MPWDLSGRVVLITGPARGIGAEAARQLAAAGCRVSLVGLEPELLEQVAGDIGEAAAWFEADVRDEDAMRAAIDGTVERFGGIDVVIANAGIATVGTIETQPPDDFQRVVDVNLLGVWRTLRLALPHVIERRGYLLPIASLAAALHAPLMTNYNAAKAGVEAMADGLRLEVAEHGVGVGVAYFGFIDTDMVRTAREHPAAAEAREDSGMGDPAPVSRAGEAIVRGVRRRSRWVVHPKWVAGVLVARGVLQPLVEFGARRRPQVQQAIRRANEEARKALAAHR